MISSAGSAMAPPRISRRLSLNFAMSLLCPHRSVRLLVHQAVLESGRRHERYDQVLKIEAPRREAVSQIPDGLLVGRSRFGSPRGEAKVVPDQATTELLAGLVGLRQQVAELDRPLERLALAALHEGPAALDPAAGVIGLDAAVLSFAIVVLEAECQRVHLAVARDAGAAGLQVSAA